MSKIINVSDKYRTNPLSLKPGGFTVEIGFADTVVFSYDKVKYPVAYVNRIKSNKIDSSIVYIKIDNVCVWTLDGIRDDKWNFQ